MTLTLISSIIVQRRHRLDLGDLGELAESIRAQGLLQPIGVNEANVLVFGERRLRACRDILGWTEIEARRVAVTSIVEGEYAENAMRKDFTVSERVAIGKAVEQVLGNRRGERTDLKPSSRAANQEPIRPDPPPLPRSVSSSAQMPRPQLVEKFPQVPAQAAPASKTRDIAAHRAGFGNARTYDAAKSVIERAVPGLIAALDKGDVSVAAALVASDQPPEVQRRFVTVSKVEQKKAVRDWRDFQASQTKVEPVRDLSEIMHVALAFKQLSMVRISPERLVEKAFPATMSDLKEHGVKVRAFLDAIEGAVAHDTARTG